MLRTIITALILCVSAIAQTTNIAGARTVAGNFTVNGLTTTVQNLTILGTCTGCPSSGGGAGGGFGTVVPANGTIQNTINMVGTSGTGSPVVVPQGFTGSLGFTNTNFLNILNYTSSPNGDYDKNGVLPVDIFGVLHDGQTPSCNIVGGNPQVSCFTQFKAFTAADVGKLVILYGAGPSAATHGGIVAGTVTASGGSGGTNGVQALVSTNGGCSYPIRGWVTVTGGAPSGSVTIWKAGYGCTSLPTTATVSTVTGTVTLTGTAYINVDLPTTIVSVQSNNTITVADTPTVSVGGTVIIYGSDDAAALQAACNGRGLAQNGGHFTHSGISLISHGITCDGNNTWIQGAGYAPLGNSGGGSNIVYAGKNAGGNDGIFISSQGWGAKLTDMGLRGNSWARPWGLVISQGNTPHGNGNSSNGIFERLWIGWMWGDGAGIENYQVSEGIFANVSTGNGDFNNFRDIHMAGVIHGLDGNNDQATEWNFLDNFEIESAYTGICAFSGTTIQHYFTEFNDTDIQMGPCVSGSGITSLVIGDYGGESSARNIIHGAGLGAADNDPVLVIHSAGVGQPPQYEDPSNVMIDLSGPINTGFIQLGDGISGSFFFGGTTGGERPAKLVMPTTYGGTFEPTLSLNGINTQQLTTPGIGFDQCGQVCNNRLGTGLSMNGNTVYADILQYATTPVPWQQHDMLGWTRNFGSVLIKSARPLGQTDLVVGSPVYGVSLGTVGTAGSTTYNYEITCSDQAGNETPPPPTVTGGSTPTIFTIATGNATLSTTNYISISALWQQRGCAYYNFYGDNGIGGTIGYLTTVDSVTFGNNNNTFADQGQFTKNTGRVPPTSTKSGALVVEGPATFSTVSAASSTAGTNVILGNMTGTTNNSNAVGAETFTAANGNLFEAFHGSNTYSGTALKADMGNFGGTFNGLFLTFLNGGTTKFTIDSNGNTALTGKLNIGDKGTCTMAAGTCSAQTLVATYSTAPVCFATYTGTGTLAGTIKIAATTTTVTPASTTGTDTAQVNWACLGN